MKGEAAYGTILKEGVRAMAEFNNTAAAATGKRERPSRISLLLFAALLLFMLFFIAVRVKDAPALGRMSVSQEPDLGAHTIAPGETIRQRFRWEEEYLEGVNVKLTRLSGSSAGTLTVTLYQGERTVQSWSVTKYGLGAAYTRFLLDQPLTGVKGEEFTLELSAPDNTDISLSLSTQSGTGSSGWEVNERTYDGQFVCMRIIEKSISRTAAFAAIGGAAAVILSILYLLLRRRPRIKPEWIFLVCYAAMGVFCLAAVPESRTPDETNHFCRAYEISQGGLISDRDFYSPIPRNFNAGGHLFTGKNDLYDILDGMDEEWDTEDPTLFRWRNTALYAPTSYLPQALGIGLASALTDRVMLILYAGRAANWLAVGAVLFLCIRWIPVGKNLLAFASLLPMNIQQFNSLSADGFAYVTAAAMLTSVLYFRFGFQGALRKRHLLLLYVQSVLLCLCKIVYAPLCLLLFLIPRERFGSRRRYWLHVFGIGTLSAAAALGWLLIASGFLEEFTPGVNSPEQVRYILTDPAGYSAVLLRTVDAGIQEWSFQAAGSALGALDVSVGNLMPAISVGLLAGTAMFGGELGKIRLTGGVRACLLCLSALISLVILTSLYVQWTGYRLSYIEGVQGRYFLPLLPLLLLGFAMHNARGRAQIRWFYLGSLAVNLCSFSAMLVQMI